MVTSKLSMKRTGFKKKTFAQAIEAKRKADIRRKSKPVTKKKVKYPSMFGIKGRRYTGVKGVLWTIFSEFIRRRDFIKYGGKCVSCNSVVLEWKLADPGHFISVTRGNNATMFHEENVNLQCKRCNNPSWSPDSVTPYRYELNKRWGEDTADKLEALINTYEAPLSNKQMIGLIEHYKEEVKKLT